MASKTPSTINTVFSANGARLIVATFTDIDDGDTWTSGLGNSGVVAYFTQDNDDPTTQASVGCAAVYSSGTFTFYRAEDNKVVALFVYLRS